MVARSQKPQISSRYSLRTLAVCLPVILSGCNWTQLLSVSSTGEQGNYTSNEASVSADGRYVAFSSGASNLVIGDTNGYYDIFIHDTVDGITNMVSVDSDEIQGNNSSSEPSISADGRYVAFRSNASNLVAGDTNGQSDIFVRDIVDGTTTRVSVDSDEVQGNIGGSEVSISGDGHYVAFSSKSSNLVAGDTNGQLDIFVRDTVEGTTRRVSLDAAGVEANDRSYNPSITTDGRYVAFTTFVTNLVPGDLNGAQDIAIRAIPEVTVTGVTPDHLPIGATTSVTITGKNFLPDSAPSLAGAQLGDIVVVDENTITMNITVPSNKPVGMRDFTVNIFGTNGGLLTGVSASCVNCVTFQ